MLAKMASYLSFRDVNSLLRTSKTAHAKLSPYRTTLPKIPIYVYLRYTPDKVELQVLIFFHRFDFQSRVERTVFLIDRRENGADELTEEENKARVVGFYKGSRDKPLEESTFIGRVEALLSLHLQTLLTIAAVYNINLEGFEDDVWYGELARLVNKSPSRSRIDVYLTANSFRQCHLDVIIASKPLCLQVTVPKLPDEFYRLPVVQRLADLRDYSKEKRVHDLTLLSASTILIYGRHNLTIDAVKQIITQWVESKRHIDLFCLEWTKTLNEEKWTDMIDNLDKRLVQVDSDIDREVKWCLTRPSDAAKLFVLSFWRSEGSLSMYS